MYELPSWSEAWRNLFHERSQLSRGATHQHAYPHYNYMAANKMQENISGYGDVRRLNTSKLCIYKLISCSRAWRDLFHERLPLVRGATHQLAYPPYKYMAANEMLENISGDAAGRMFVT